MMTQAQKHSALRRLRTIIVKLESWQHDAPLACDPYSRVGEAKSILIRVERELELDDLLPSGKQK